MEDYLVREARLLPQFEHLYPGVPPGVWLPAADLGAALLMQHLRAPSPPELGPRLLDEQHFEFRGGNGRGTGSPLRTRHGDRPRRDVG